MNKTEMGSESSSVSTTVLQNSGSDLDLRREDLIEERKRKRKQSNRESARRSRKRKQKLMDDLAVEAANLRKENGQIVAGISFTTEHYVAIEAENSVLRAQLVELNHRLNSLNEIVDFVESSSAVAAAGGFGMETGDGGFHDGAMNYLSLGFYNQPIVASASTAGDVFNF